ncbi:MAG: ImmA/IrrE family metallo-endopeptidase, partial [Clostridia bacterium]|nr:ImmA/IrrE family metallo-endopeptidase [Clostridia bacterium]
RANSILQKCNSRDPYKIARQCGIELIVKELGALKGFYKVIYRNPFIFLNKSMSRSMARIVCAHELGHHLLHREFATFGFEETSLFSPASRREYEANLFAAELLIADKEIAELLEYGYTEEQIAAAIGMDKQLTELKLAAYKLKNAK